MTRRSLITLFLIAILFICVQLFLRPVLRGSPVLSQSISILYLWIPGIVALIFARMEGLKIPIFARPNRFFYLIPVITMSICLFAFLLTIPFGAIKTPNAVFADQTFYKIIGYGALFLITSYLFVTVLFGLIVLGGEIYWRGYLFEKWKKQGLFRAIWIIALVWSLWQIPITILSYSPGLPNFAWNILSIFALNFILSPVLTYFRVKGKSVLTAATFYSSLIASFLYFLVLFPPPEMRVIGIYAVLTIVCLILYSLFLKLYSSSAWEKINE
ncbi:MAG: hypothetical protein K1000chlam3_00081 [Chlamydiae bacterium]|nr:hypothetical protein [Chlamydiota bacterium]